MDWHFISLMFHLMSALGAMVAVRWLYESKEARVSLVKFLLEDRR